MKYVITRIFVDSVGGFHHDACMDVEVFDCYFSALRWFWLKRSLAKLYDYSVSIYSPGSINDYGRVVLYEMKSITDHGTTLFYLSRIYENGFH